MTNLVVTVRGGSLATTCLTKMKVHGIPQMKKSCMGLLTYSTRSKTCKTQKARREKKAGERPWLKKVKRKCKCKTFIM
jgi:hypothetical protein